MASSKFTVTKATAPAYLRVPLNAPSVTWLADVKASHHQRATQWVEKQERSRQYVKSDAVIAAKMLIREAARSDHEAFVALRKALREVLRGAPCAGAWNTCTQEPAQQIRTDIDAFLESNVWGGRLQQLQAVIHSAVERQSSASGTIVLDSLIAPLAQQLVWNGLSSLVLAQQILQHVRTASLPTRGSVDEVNFMNGIAIPMVVLGEAPPLSASNFSVKKVEFVNAPIRGSFAALGQVSEYLLSRSHRRPAAQKATKVCVMLQQLSRLLPHESLCPTPAFVMERQDSSAVSAFV